MKKMKKFLSLLLVLCLVMSMVCTTALATEIAGDPGESINQNVNVNENGGDEIGNGGSAGDTNDGETNDGKTNDGETNDDETNDDETNDDETNDDETNDGKTNDGETNDDETNDGKTNDGETNDDETNDGKTNDGNGGTGNTNNSEGSDEDETEETEDESDPEPTFTVDFNQESCTLTIKGEGDVTADLVLPYRSRVKTVVVDIEGSVAAGAFSYCTQLEEISINGASTIGDAAFRYSTSNLKKISLSNIGTVGAHAAQDCKSLVELNLTNIDTIDEEAFLQCSSLKTINLSSVKTLNRSAFGYCAGLTELNLNGVEIGSTVFYGCTGLEKVTLKNMDTTGLQAFNGCTGLQEVTLESIGTTGNQMFYGCTGLKTVTMKDIGTIGSSTFQNCTGSFSLALSNVETIGETAFLSSTGLASVTMENIGTVGKNAFASCKNLKTATLDNVDTIGQYAFYNCTGLEKVTMGKVRLIDNYAFWYCTGLTTIDSLSNVTESIGGFAFYGCSSLTGLTVANAAKMGYIGSNDEIMARVQAILAGRFQLDNAAQIKALTLEDGWTAGAVGQSTNWNTYDNGTQLMEQARWANVDNAVAEVKVDAYYTGEKQMDYIFVADLSGSMALRGNEDDSNARFYDMQSKLLDMTGQLLSAPGYDCQVAIVTFGGYVSDAAPGTAASLGFTGSVTEAQNYIKGLEPLNENTDYTLGLNEVLELLKSHDTNRNTVMVFLSDGRPTRNGKTELNSASVLSAYDKVIAGIAQQIKDAGVQGIYGVLHSPDATNVQYAQNAMNAVCDYVYQSTDTDSFGAAMNKAFTTVYGDNTVTIPVNAADFNVNSLKASAGNVTYSNGTITWIIEGMPFTQHTLTYTLTLKDELAERVGTYSYNINDGVATFGTNGASVGLELTLSRTVTATTAPATPVTPVTPVTPSTEDTEEPNEPQPEEEPSEEPEEEIDDEDVPLADLPEEPELPEEEIPDEDVPLAAAAKTGDNAGLWLAAAAMSAMGLMALSGKRKEDGEV